MRKRRVWWTFLRINDDGWSSGFRSVDLLLKHLRRKSRSVASRDRYCYNLWRICLRIKVGPDELLSRARGNPDSMARLIQDFADEYQAKGSVRYANNIIHLTKTFFKVNKVQLDLHSYYQPIRSRRRREHVPSLDEALKMADVAGSLRDRLIILVLTYTGLRNSTLRALVYNEAYPDPLLQEHTIRKELERGEECLILVVHEIMKQRIPNACKNRVFYYTFIPPRVTECLRLLLHGREERYGSILDDEPIFMTENRRIPLSERRKTPISARELQEIVKKAAKRAGIKNWKCVYPHCLRKTYESFLRNQPDDVRLDVKEREFLFGHTLPRSQDTYFDKTKIEKMRAKYAKMIFEPVTGIEKEERVISEDELQNFLQQGWHFEATLPSGKVVVYRKIIKKSEGVKATNYIKDFYSNANIKKDNTSTGNKKSPKDESLSLINQQVAQAVDRENVQAQKKLRDAKLEIWINPRNQEIVTDFSRKVSAEERKAKRPPPSSNKAKQKSLLSFIS